MLTSCKDPQKAIQLGIDILQQEKKIQAQQYFYSKLGKQLTYHHKTTNKEIFVRKYFMCIVC